MPADSRGHASPPADVILHNGRIATQDERRSFAQAAAVQGGKFSPSAATRMCRSCAATGRRSSTWAAARSSPA